MSQVSNENYTSTLLELKEKIRQARLRANFAVNTELLKVYWEIGNTINQQEQTEGWGAKIIDKLAADLRIEFADMKGLSPRNLRYMRDFASAYPQFVILQQGIAKSHDIDNQPFTILQQSVAKLPWGHNCTLLDKLNLPDERLYYAQKAVQNGWTRDNLVNQIEGKLHERQGSLINNFTAILPAYDSELAIQLFKDPYHLDFIKLSEEAKEKDLEDAFITHIIKLLLELGDGFAFMGRQKKFEAGEREFFIDLLFYHTKLRRYVVIDLKIGEFEAEFVSKMNLYLGLVDDSLKTNQDEPSIGLILCKTKNKIVAEYALRDTQKPIGIAEYKIGAILPDDIKGELPSIEEIEQKLDQEIKDHESPTDARLKALKAKLKTIKTEEIQTAATHDLLLNLYHEGLKPLYKQIIERMSVFADEFHDIKYNWNAANKVIVNFEQLDELWNDKQNSSMLGTLSFSYTLFGLKKAGTENYNESIELKFQKDTYWYGFTIINYNNQQPFLKKLYHQPLAESEKNLIVEILLNKVIDRIEYFVAEFDKKLN